MVSYLLRVTLLYAVWHPVHYSAMYVCVLFHDHSRINICIFFHLKSKQGSCLNLFIFYLLLAGLFKTRMWANAQRDGHPAEYRWRPLLNAAKFGWRPLPECHAVTLSRRETRWNLQGCPKLANRSQPLVGGSSPYYEDMWKRYCYLTSFFPIVDTRLSSKDIARQSCAMVPK